MQPDFTTEAWLPAPGFPPFVEVSNLGNVRKHGQVIRPWLANTGYFEVNYGRNHRFRRLVHHLVTDAFLGPPPAGMERNHIDGNRRNNALTNLEYVTRSGNQLHRYALNGSHPLQGAGNRAKTHCPRGHAYTGANLRLYVDKKGRTSRACHTCLLARRKASGW